MRKNMKKWGKGMITVALTIAMLLGQFPAGTVLVATAAPKTNSELASEETSEYKPFIAGVESVIGTENSSELESPKSGTGASLSSEVLPESSGETEGLESLIYGIVGLSEIVTAIQGFLDGNEELLQNEELGGVNDPSDSGDPVPPSGVTVLFADSVSIESGDSFTINGDVSFMLEGVTEGDDVSVSYVGDNTAILFSDVDIGNDKIFNYDNINGFELSGEDKEKYFISGITLKGNLVPKTSKDSVFDLTVNNTFNISDEDTINFAEGKDGNGGKWYGQDIPSLSSLVILDGKVLYAYEVETNSLLPLGDLLLTEDNQPIDNIIVFSNGIYYGPISIRYNYDCSNPDFNIGQFKYHTVEGPIAEINANNMTITDASGISSIIIGESDEDYSLSSSTINDYYNLIGNWSDNLWPNGSKQINRETPKYYYYIIEDNVGNKTAGQFDSVRINDQTKPKLNSVDVIEYAYSNSNPILSSLKIKVNASDEGAGLESVTIDLYDGVGENVKKYDSATFPVSDDMKNEWNSGEDGIDYSSYYGYQLHFVIDVLDRAGNHNYYYAYFKDGSIQLSNAIDSYDNAKTEGNTLDKTFAILGAGDNAPQISISSSNHDYEINENNQYVFYMAEREVSASFANMALTSVSFFADGNVTYNSSDYNSTEHCYKYDIATIKFTRKDDNPYYPFQIRRDSLNNIVSFAFDGDWNKEFYLDKSEDVNINIVLESDYSIAEKHGNQYYNGDVNAVITVSGKGLPKPDIWKTYIGSYMKSDTNDLIISSLGNNATWEVKSEEGIQEYQVKVPFSGDSGDKKYELKLHARKSRRGTWSSLEDCIFIIDTTKPAFDVNYSGETTSYIDEDNNKFDYYYGLIGGDGRPSDIVSTATITEANFYKEDMSIQVSKDGGAYESVSFEANDNPYGITAVSAVAENQPDNKNNSGNIVITIPGKEDHSNDGKYVLKIGYSDPIGHKMNMVESAKTPSPVVTGGVYIGTERNNYIDTTHPMVKLSVSAEGREHENDPKDYYKENFSVTFEVDEKNIDSTKIKAYVNEDLEANQMSQISSLGTSGIVNRYVKTVSEEGEYVFHIEGTDKAGNKIAFDSDNQGNNATNYDKANMESARGSYDTATKVLDKTNPKVRLDVVTEATKKDINETYDRFFFNKIFDASFTVTDMYLDEKDVTVKYGANNDREIDDYTTASVSADQTSGITSNCSETECKYDYKATIDGLYIFELQGKDKAGNPVVIYSEEGSATDYNKFFDGDALDGKVQSYIFVVDQIAPSLTVKMDDFYNAELKKDGTDDKYIISKNMPYQKKDRATVSFIGDDQTPVEVKYFIKSSKSKNDIDKWENGRGPEKDIVIKEDFTESQIIWIENLSIEDLAGNIVVMPSKTNMIYLDVNALDIKSPEVDGLKPTVDFVAKASSGRGPSGNPLYKDTVTIIANINDNLGEITFKDEDGVERKVSSSGLYKVYYEVLVNGSDSTGNCNVTSNANGSLGEKDDEGAYAVYKGSGPDFDNKDGNPDEELISSDTLTFVFPKDKFNFNDIVIRIWAIDNAGNMIKKSEAAFYAFGIDITSPTISVSYDNNDAQNGKYFKANRTAYITIEERNFTPGSTAIITQSAAHISGWSYSKDNTPGVNGDHDRWTATVLFDTDGDYTLNVTTSDLLGWSASGVNWGNSVAPTEFTIDKTKPLIFVSFDNNNVLNGRYYNANRRASIDITEHNFDAKDAVIIRTASIAEGTVAVPGVGAWSRTNDVNRTEVYFGNDGDYSMQVNYTDLAGNEADTYLVELFTIDTVAPDLEIGGVEDKHAYNGNVAPTITYHDINYDKNSAEVEITGYKHSSGENLKGTRTDERFGGSFICENIEEIKENDDVYTAVGRIRDLAGNETTKEVKFSVNRFGSTYILDEVTDELVDTVYTNSERTLGVKEINVNELNKNEVTYSVNGNVTTLLQGSDYTVKSDNPGWWEYNYSINASNFAKEGRYNVILHSEDAAGNSNTNSTIRANGGKTNELPIEFVIDKTAPSLILTGVEENGRYRDESRILVVRYEDNSFVSGLNLYVNDQLVKQLDSKALADAGGEIEYQLQSRASWQNVRVEAVDAASNSGNVEISRFLLTRNGFIQFVNNIPLLVGSIIGFVAVLTGIFVIILLRRRRRNR